MITQRKNQSSTALQFLQRSFLLFAVLIGLAMMPLQSFATQKAQQGAGKVIFVFGNAWKIDTKGGKYDIKRGMVVKVGETIETSASGQVQIRMNDNGLISIRPSSQFLIKAFKYSSAQGADTSDDKSYFQLLKGGFRSITGAVGETNKKHYKVITPVATIGIRGTDYSARLCAGDCSTGDGLFVGVWYGAISVTNDTSVLNVDAGQFGYVANATSQGQQVDSLPAGLLVAGAGIPAESPSAGKPTTTMAELAAGDTPLTQPSDISLPSTGTASYNLTNISGNNSTGASVNGGTVGLNANFGTMSVDSTVALNMNDGSTWQGSATNMSLQNNGNFSGSMSGVSSNNDPAYGNSSSGSGNVSGSLAGLGNGTTPTGASLNYNMSATFLPIGSTSVSGQASTP